jgi:hypothetical protein
MLFALTAIYGVVTPLNLWLGSAASQRADQQLARVFYSGAFWNAVVAILCFSARRLMRRHTKLHLVLGACAVAGALLVVMRVWLSGLLHGRNPFPVIEAVLTWLPMLYAMLYAMGEANREETI